MEREKADKIIEELRKCEDIALTNFRVEREKINGKQEGYQNAMFQARKIVSDFIEEDKQ